MGKPYIEIYRSSRGWLLRQQWRARIVGANGRKLFVTGEGYNNLGDLTELCRGLLPDLEIRQLDPLNN